MNQREDTKIESGLQLLARIGGRPIVRGLESKLFDNGPSPKETVELCGDVSSGKTLLLTQLVAKCILPSNHNGIPIQGHDIAVIFVNTDHHFRITKLIELMLARIARVCQKENICYTEDAIKTDIIIPSLDKLQVVNCYDYLQFKLTLETLDDILLTDCNIGLIAVDSISSFYWQARETSGVWMMDQYLKNVLKILQKHILLHNIVAIYTKPNDFGSEGNCNGIELSDEPTMEKINYRINLAAGSSCFIQTAQRNAEIKSKIDRNGITWIIDN